MVMLFFFWGYSHFFSIEKQKDSNWPGEVWSILLSLLPIAFFLHFLKIFRNMKVNREDRGIICSFSTHDEKKSRRKVVDRMWQKKKKGFGRAQAHRHREWKICGKLGVK